MGLSWSDLGYAVPGYGAYKAGKDIYDWSQSGAKDKAAGLDKAAGEYQQYGQQNWAKGQEGLNRQLGEYGKAQGVYDSQQGYFNSPGYLEQLYKQRQGGTDATFNYASQQAQNQNFNHMSAMGLGNSTYSAQTGNNLQAHLIADQQSQMAGLASGASGEQRQRMSDQLGGQMGIAQGESGAIGQTYQQGIQNLTDFQKNQIAAQLTKSGLKQEQINQILGLGMGVAQIATAGSGAGGAKAV